MSNTTAVGSSSNTPRIHKVPFAGLLGLSIALLVVATLSSATQLTGTSSAQSGSMGASVFEEEMVLIEGGSFMMGDVFGEGRENEQPVHRVTVSDFYLSAREVTVAEFRAFVEATGYVTSAEGPENSAEQMRIMQKIGAAQTDEERRKLVDEALSYGGSAIWISEGQRFGFGWDTKATWKNAPFEQGDSDPAVNLSWVDAIHYCIWMSEKAGLPAAYDPTTGGFLDENGEPTGDVTRVRGYRLPTEAEWEYAAREGGKQVRFGNGKETALSNEINYRADAEGIPYSESGEYRMKTTPVGSFAPNALGLYDMSGNAWEWVHDFYRPYNEAESVNPFCAEGYSKVIRGGRWGGDASEIRNSRRDHYEAPNRCNASGFRVARSK
jgi:formylglycine-generating enzyme required for sulfatase activity